MDTETVHKQRQVLLRGGGLSGGVYLFLSLILCYFYPISSKFTYVAP